MNHTQRSFRSHIACFYVYGDEFWVWEKFIRLEASPTRRRYTRHEALKMRCEKNRCRIEREAKKNVVEKRVNLILFSQFLHLCTANTIETRLFLLPLRIASVEMSELPIWIKSVSRWTQIYTGISHVYISSVSWRENARLFQLLQFIATLILQMMWWEVNPDFSN